MKKISLTVILLLGMLSSSWAQNTEATYDAFHITLGLNGGIDGFTMDNGKDGKFNFGPTFGFDFGFYVFPTEHIGIRSGFNVNYAASNYSYDNLKETREILESPYHIDYACISKNTKVEISSINLQIPLQLALLWDHWYADLGFKLMVPITFDAKTSFDEAVVDATIRETGTHLDPNSTDAFAAALARKFGCGTYGSNAEKKKLDLKSNWSLLASVDFGYRFSSSSSTTWTIGVYADYALTSINVKNNFLDITSHSDHTKTVKLQSLPINNLGFFDAGIKIRCDFGFTKMSK